MSDISTGNFQRDVDKIIDEALRVWEECGFKDMSLWETFQDDFKDFTEEDFKSASIHHLRKLRNYLRKFGVWIRKQQRYTISRSLYNALLEEEPTDWTEAEVMACKDKEEFASYHISCLLEFDFGRKPFRTFTPIYPSGPRTAATSSALSTPAPVNAFTILPSTTTFVPPPTRPTGPEPALSASSSASPTPPGEALVSTSSSPNPAPVDASTILPSTTTFVPPPAPAPGTRPASAAYTQPSGTGPTPAVHSQSSSTGPAHAVHNPQSAINPPAAMSSISTGYGRDSSKLAKIYTNDGKYSGRNDTSMFKLETQWNNTLNSLSKNFRMGSTGGQGLCQAIKWMTWMKWDKIQDEMDRT